MRTRRRPVLQDKTPVNTPQKPRATRASAKTQLVPVVEIKAQVRRAGKGKSRDDAHTRPADVEESVAATESRPEGTQQPEEQAAPQEPPTPVARPAGRTTARARRGRGKTAGASARKENPQPLARTDAHFTGDSVLQQADTAVDALPSKHVPPQSPSEQPETDENAPQPLPQNNAIPLRHISPPDSPTAGRQAPPPRKRKPLQPASVPVPQRYSTPDTVPVAEDDSSPSDVVKAIFDTPSPARIIRAPIPVQSTPLGGRLEKHFSPLPPVPVRGRHESSIRRWNNGVSRAYSPLPPSSPPPPSPPTQEPVAGPSRLRSEHQPRPQSEDDDFDHDMENEAPAPGPVYVSRENNSDDDPFGLLAAERRVKALRQRRAMAESSRAPGVPRAPLGTLALDEVPSSDVPIPEHLPTPLPSDDDHNIDDLYLDIDPVRPGIPRVERVEEDYEMEEEVEEEEDGDKGNVPTADYDLNEDKENLRPPHLARRDDADSSPLDLALDTRSDDDAENALPSLQDENDENLPIPPLLAASAKKARLAELFEPSSSSASPTHALRTPHKHRSAHKRTPLPTPHFSDTGFSDSPLTAKSVGRRDSSPSPIKPVSVAPRPRSVAGPSGVRRPFAPLEMEVDEPAPEVEASPVPKAVAGRKRTRAQAEQTEGDDSSDPRAAVRKLESLLPKRSKTRTTAASSTARGRGRGRGTSRGRGGGRERGAAAAAKGKGRAAPEEEDLEESDVENSDVSSSPPKAKKARTSRGTGRGRGASTSRGRARGRSAAPVSASGRPTSKRGRSTSKGKGKERAEEVDPEEDEERARKRQERIEYFRKLQEYSIEKEDVYVI
ncbi:hypothetical protein OH77DRAFT_1586885 [Trametes cingulata]|nr:hypothetical protein OH77DRAFT_1586885 [Trametes cingulata]